MHPFMSAILLWAWFGYFCLRLMIARSIFLGVLWGLVKGVVALIFKQLSPSVKNRLTSLCPVVLEMLNR